jgi:hypothetical protein
MLDNSLEMAFDRKLFSICQEEDMG